MKKRQNIFWTTSLVALVLLVHNGTEPLFLIGLSLMPVLILFFYRKRSLFPLALYLLVFGALGRYTRYFRQGYMSDVLPVTRDFIGYLLAGRNPYGVMVYSAKGPTPFLYLPFELLWFLPPQILGIDLRFFEMLIACLVPLVVFLIAHLKKNWQILPGLAVVSLTPFLLDLSSDGSNDNSAVFLLLLSVLLLVLSRQKKSQSLFLFSAIILGCAVAFKHYAAFYFLFLIPYFLPKKEYLKTAILTAVILIIPFLLASPNGFWQAQLYIENRPGHPLWGWNLWNGLRKWLIPSPSVIKFTRLAATLIAITTCFRIFSFKKFNQVFAAASLTMLVYLLLSPWTTSAYFTFVIPLICLSVINSDPRG